jgi:hypothetical protein
MFGMLKVLFYTLAAVVAGVFIGTVPVGGRTIAEWVVGSHSVKPVVRAAAATPRPAHGDPGRVPLRRPAKIPAALSETSPATAGAANVPDGHSADDKKALDRLIAGRARPR